MQLFTVRLEFADRMLPPSDALLSLKLVFEINIWDW